ncbi:MAG: transketolase family protein [Spirochaetota bacterium]|nr:transketolase family protein [Spirochaetota bacterium]
MRTPKASRVSFGETIAKLGDKHPEIVVLEADLAKSTYSYLFGEKFPDRYFEMGIAEANMIGTGSGLALAGKTAYICSFACFVTGRYDIIRMSIAYPKANVRIIGTHAGIAIGDDGNSQQGLEDISIMRSLPNMAVIQPVDDMEAEQAIEYSVKHKGPMFIRLTRQKLEPINSDNYRFQFGKGVTLKEGKDLTIIATGGVVYNALQAAYHLDKEGVSCGVINIHTIKPIDKELIIKAARETRRLVTVEDHNIIGGLGSAVSEVISEHYPVHLRRIGLNDCFGESGDPAELYQKHGLDIAGIQKTVKDFIKENQSVLS